MKLLLSLILSFPLFAANDVYIAQASAGANDGSSCVNAKAVSYFNTSGNWSGSPSGIQIGPATTVHLCGTFTGAANSNMLTAQGNGSSGSPVTILFETGAIFTAPYWAYSGNGAIMISSRSYITVDGGSNGLITASANGASRANQQGSFGVEVISSNNIEVKNLTFTNLYVQVKNNATTPGPQIAAIDSQNSSSVRYDNNTVTDSELGVQLQYNSGTTTSIEVDHNTISNDCAGIDLASGGTSPAVSGILIHNNDISNNGNWDAGDNGCHQDAFHGWAEAGGNGGTVTGMQIYNEFYHGDMGCHQNGFIYFEADVGTNTSAKYYNNLMINTSDNSSCGVSPQAYPASGYVGLKGPNCGAATLVANNTILNATPEIFAGIGVFLEGGCSNVTVENNIIGHLGSFIVLNSGSTLTASDFNDFYNSNGAVDWNYQNSDKGTFAAWKSACACDANSILTNPNLGAGNIPNTGSPVIAAGANLTSVGVAGLDIDRAGISRPSSTAWDIGAYQAQSGSCVINTSSLPGGTVGVTYNQTLSETNCSGAWSVSVGSLPANLFLNTSTGVINGTPTSAATSSFTVAINSATQPLSIVISPAVVPPPTGLTITVNGNIQVQ